MAKCPKYDALVTNVKIEDTRVDSFGGASWKGISYVCPWCNHILSVQIDPVALKTDIIRGVLQALGRP